MCCMDQHRCCHIPLALIADPDNVENSFLTDPDVWLTPSVISKESAFR